MSLFESGKGTSLKDLHDAIKDLKAENERLDNLTGGYASDILKHQDEIKALKAYYKTLPVEPLTWISVDERLPEDNSWSFVMFGIEGGNASSGFWDSAKIWVVEGIDCDNVTHWMPIPVIEP